MNVNGGQKRGRAILVVLAGLLLSLALAEGALRLWLPPSALYRGVAAVPELNQRYFEYLALEHRGGDAFDAGAYDADLGWDIDAAGDRIRGQAVRVAARAPGVRRVVAIGDSFTYGAEVADGETYAAALERLLCRTEVLNMGVGGYGIDQAVLKHRLHGAKYRPDAVVFGIHPPDFERATFAFFSAAKPVFRRRAAAGGIILENVPVPPPNDEIARIRRRLDDEVYVAALARSVFYHLRWRLFGAAKFFAEGNAVVGHLLETLAREAVAANGRLLVVQIPMGDVFERTVSWHDALSRNLIAVYRERGIDHIDLETEWRREMPSKRILRDFYIRRDDGSVGHLSPGGNRAVARAVAARLRPLGFDVGPTCGR